MGTQRAPALTAIAVPVGGPTPSVRSRALSGPRRLPPFGDKRDSRGRRVDTCLRARAGTRDRSRARGSLCPQAARRAVTSTLALMAGLRGKRQRRELAKALVGVLLVRDSGSLWDAGVLRLGAGVLASAGPCSHQDRGVSGRWKPARRVRCFRRRLGHGTARTARVQCRSRAGTAARFREAQPLPGRRRGRRGSGCK
jgi:hypothetical protein